ncbi:MAG: roadblock/LC7 domain-containing protein [Geobacteraceae bacterium]|nr:roadblock/LC7 domain-containing protein [Geobacteraceae bacterium]NTW78781.1 roadblock/LC7 domain-containing protein [Geobacteraceae bacterium]
MKDILQHINSVDGVMGSALFSPKGEVLAHACSALIDAESLKKAASLTLECTHGLQISETLDLIDFRYTDGHVLVKAFPGAMLFLLCANGINLQVLSITLKLAVKKLEAKLPGDVPSAVQAPAAEDSGSGDGMLRMNISHLANKETSASFDALGMVAVSQSTSQYISDFYKTPFKKLILTNVAAGTSGTFPVMILKEMDHQYDGSVVVGPGIERKLKVSEGDKVEVKIG